jgi:hypothetical protein
VIEITLETEEVLQYDPSDVIEVAYLDDCFDGRSLSILCAETIGAVELCNQWKTWRWLYLLNMENDCLERVTSVRRVGA